MAPVSPISRGGGERSVWLLLVVVALGQPRCHTDLYYSVPWRIAPVGIRSRCCFGVARWHIYRRPYHLQPRARASHHGPAASVWKRWELVTRENEIEKGAEFTERKTEIREWELSIYIYKYIYVRLGYTSIGIGVLPICIPKPDERFNFESNPQQRTPYEFSSRSILQLLATDIFPCTPHDDLKLQPNPSHRLPR